MIRPPRSQERHELGTRAWSYLEHLPPDGEERLEIDSRELAPEWAAGLEEPIEDRPHERIEGDVVGVADEVERAPHEPAADRTSRLDEIRQLLGFESLEPAPEADVGVLGHLRLHADQVLDHLGRRHRDPGEEVLAREGRPIEGTAAECAPGPRRTLGHDWSIRAGLTLSWPRRCARARKGR